MTLKSSFRFARINKVDRDSLHSAFGKFYLLFAPWNTTWHCFYPINSQMPAKMVGIVNNVYFPLPLTPEIEAQAFRNTSALGFFVCCSVLYSVVQKWDSMLAGSNRTGFPCQVMKQATNQVSAEQTGLSQLDENMIWYWTKLVLLIWLHSGNLKSKGKMHQSSWISWLQMYYQR